MAICANSKAWRGFGAFCVIKQIQIDSCSAQIKVSDKLWSPVPDDDGGFVWGSPAAYAASEHRSECEL